MSVYREETYRELLVADQRRAASASRRKVIKTYVLASGVCLVVYVILTSYYNKHLSKNYKVNIDGVEVTVLEDYISSLDLMGSGENGVTTFEYFRALLLWRLVPSAALLLGIAAFLFSGYAYLYPEEFEKKMVTYFSAKDVKGIHDRAMHADSKTNEYLSAKKIYDEALLTKLSEERFKKHESASGRSKLLNLLSTPTTNNSDASANKNFMSFLWNRGSGVSVSSHNQGVKSNINGTSSALTSSDSIAAAFAGGSKTAMNKSIHTQEGLNRFMASEEKRLSSVGRDSDNANITSGSGTNILSALNLFGVGTSNVASTTTATEANIISKLFGGEAVSSSANGVAASGDQQTPNGVEVIFGLGAANNANVAGSSNANGLGLDFIAASLASNPNNHNLTALLGPDARQRLAVLLQQQNSHSSLVVNGQSLAGYLPSPTGLNSIAPTGLMTPQQLRMLQMWQSLSISDISNSVTNAKRWVHSILVELVKDVQRCDKEFASRNMNDLDCHHSLMIPHKLAVPTAAPAAGATPAPAVGGGFGAAGATVGGFGAKPSGFGAPAAAAPALTKGQQLLNEKGTLSQKIPTADTMDLIEFINLRLGLEKTLDATNSIMYRAARNNSLTTAAPPTAPAPAQAVGFGAAPAVGFGGGFGAQQPPAAPTGFGVAATATVTSATKKPENDKSLTSPQERQYHRPYIIHRLEAFVSNRNMSAFANDGFDIEGWNEALPLDAHLILHVLQLRCPRLFADAVRLAHFPEHSSQTQTAFRVGGASPSTSMMNIFPTIHVGSVGEPYFFVEGPRGGSSAQQQFSSFLGVDEANSSSVSASRFHKTRQTSDSLFEALVLFAALMKRARPNDTQVPDGFYSIVV